MKKFSFVICVVALVVVMLVGATAFASSGVDTNEHIYIGEYAHNNVNNTDPDVVIVYGTASVDAQDGVTERGIIIEKGADKWLFPALAWNEQTGNFGVAIIRSTVEKGEYVARAFARVGGTYDEDEKEFVGGIIEEGDPISLNFNAVLAQTEESIIVTENTPVDLKELITVTGGEKAEIVYTVTEKDGLELEIANGVVSYVSGAGRTTITATHGLSENSITFDVMVYDEVYEITDKTQLATLTTDHANSYVKLTADLSVETADMAVTNVDNVDNAYVIGGSFRGFFDGQSHKITYDFTCDEKDMLFRGVFCELGGELKNLMVEGFAEQKNDYGYFFIQQTSAGSVVENCYVNVRGQQNASKSGNWTSTCFMVGTSSGTIKDCIFNMAGRIDSTSEFTKSMALQRYGTGVWENIAWICPDTANPWRGGMYSALMQDYQLENVVYYKTINAFVQGDGKSFDYAVVGQKDNGDGTFSDKYDYVYTPIATAQVMGDAWTIDRTQYAESIKLNSALIWKTEVVEIETKEQFLALGELDANTQAVLTAPITLTDADAITFTSGSYTYGGFVQTLNAVLDGNGNKITYEYTVDSEEINRFAGLFFEINGTLKNVVIEVRTTSTPKYSYALCTTTGSAAKIQNVYFDILMSKPGTDGNGVVSAVIGNHNGVVENCVISADWANATGTKKGLPIQLYKNGTWKNVALIWTTTGTSYTNRGSLKKVTGAQLDNVAYYTSIANLLSSTGKAWSTEKNPDGTWTTTNVFTDITTAQNIGTAWTIDATGIKLNGNYVYEVPVSE